MRLLEQQTGRAVCDSDPKTPQPDTHDRAPCCDHAVGTTMAGMKLKLDLHDIYNRGGDIECALRAIINEAVTKKAPLVEIIPGKGSGALKKRVLRFLEQKRSSLCTTGWRRTPITSAGSSCTSAGMTDVAATPGSAHPG